MRTAVQNLYERWGLSSSDIAHALGVTQRVARLARNGSAPADGAENLDVFLEDLHVRAGIDEPGAWMAARVVDGYTVTRWDLYAAGHADFVMMNARGVLTDEAMLSSFDPNWRSTYWTSFTTVLGEDGSLSVRGKTYDEIQAQR